MKDPAVERFLGYLEKQLPELDLLNNSIHLSLVIEFISLRFSYDLIQEVFLQNSIDYPVNSADVDIKGLIIES